MVATNSNELAEALAAHASAANSHCAGDADEAIWEGLHLIAQASSNPGSSDAVHRAAELLGNSAPPSLSSPNRSHRILACLAASGAYPVPDSGEVYVPFSLPMRISGLTPGQGPVFRHGSMGAVSDAMSSRFGERLDVLLFDDLYSEAEISSIANVAHTNLARRFTCLLISDDSDRPDFLSAQDFYKTQLGRLISDTLHAFSFGVIKARAQSHFLTSLVMHYDGPELWDWFEQPFADALNAYFLSVCDDAIDVDIFNPALIPYAVGSAQAREIARSSALGASSAVGDTARYQQLRRPGRPKQRVLTYEFRSRATGRSKLVTVDFRALADELANDDLEIVFEQELFRWGFREEGPYG